MKLVYVMWVERNVVLYTQLTSLNEQGLRNNLHNQNVLKNQMKSVSSLNVYLKGVWHICKHSRSLWNYYNCRWLLTLGYCESFRTHNHSV